MKYALVSTSALSDLLEKRTWRPWPIRTPFLVIFITICIILCFSIQLIIQGCEATGCHVFGDGSATKMSHGTSFVYNLLPTIVSLGLSLFWALPNHDLMRLEPYFQMSKSDGAPADALFLDYPYTLPLQLQFNAAKRKHYVVLISSCITLLMTFLTTPLMTGIFDESVLTKHISDEAIRSTIPQGAGDRISSRFMYTAYNYAWRGGQLPPFTTPTYALLPMNGTEMRISNETWRAETTLVAADLRCESAGTTDIVVDPDSNTVVKTTITARNGTYKVVLCDVSLWNNGSCDKFAPFDSKWISIAARVSGKGGQRSPGIYIYAFSPRMDNITIPLEPRNITAILCTTSYYSQPVTAAFAMPSGDVLGANSTGAPTKFSEAVVFDRIINGDSNATSVSGRFQDKLGCLSGLGYWPEQLPNVDSQLVRQFGRRPGYVQGYYDPFNHGPPVPESESAVYMDNVHGLMGFALSNRTMDTLGELLDPLKLEEAYRNALQMLFALAVSVEMVDGNATEAVTVMRDVLKKGFIIDRVWAHGVQGGLGAAIALAVILTAMVRRRPCELDGEPNSLAASLRLLSASPKLSAEMEGIEFNSPKTILKALNQGSRRYKLELVPGQGPRVKVISPPQDNHDPSKVPKRKEVPGQENPEAWKEELWVFRTLSTLGFLFCFLAVAGLLVFAFLYSRKHNGIPLFAPINSFQYKIPFSYLPIFLSMAVEPALVSLGSCHCMLGPYKILHHGNAPSSKSLALDYDKSPPQFQLLRALRTRNIPLVFLTTAILLSNVLAVAFAGLFSPMTAKFHMQIDVQTSEAPKIQSLFSVPAYEMYYILAEQLSVRGTTPTWTTPEYYVLPFHPIESDGVQRYEGSTFAVGVDVQCALVPRDLVDLECDDCDNDPPRCAADVSKPYYSVSANDTCFMYMEMDYSTTSYSWNGVSADGMFFTANYECPDHTFFALWAERPAEPHPKNQSLLYGKNLDAVILKCTTADRVVKLNATVSTQGQVLSISDIHRLDVNETAALYPADMTTSWQLASTFMRVIWSGIRMENNRYEKNPNSHELRWFDYLMATIEPSIIRNLPNITHLPDTTSITTAFEDVYRRLFAINLKLYEELISVGDSRIAPATAIVQMDRVGINGVLFYVAISILLFVILVLGMLYWEQGSPIGHLPTSLVGTYAHLYASNAKGDCGQVQGKTPEERAKQLDKLGNRYAYGLFPNGRHVGVYREE